MADTQTNLFFRLKAMYEGEAFQTVRQDLKGTGKAVSQFTVMLGEFDSTLGKASGELSNFLTKLANGSIWEVGAAGIRLVWKGAQAVIEHFKELMDVTKALKRQMDELHETTSAAFAQIKSEYEGQVAAIAAATKAKSGEISETLKLAKAEAELAEAKEKAAGGDGSNAKAELAQKEIELQKEKIALAKAAAQEEEAAALKAIQAANEQLQVLEHQREVDETRIKLSEDAARQRATEGSWLDKILDKTQTRYQLEASINKRVEDSMEKLKNTKGMKDLIDDLDRTDKKIAEIESTVGKAQKALDAARDKLKTAANEEEALIMHVQATSINAATETANKELEIQRELMEQKRRAGEAFLQGYLEDLAEEQKKEKEMRDAALKEDADARIKAAEAAKDAAMAALDDQLAEAKRKLGDWEREAKGARGMSIEEYTKNRRQRQREEEKERKRQEKEVARAEAELDRLNKKKRLTDDEKRRKEELEGFIAAQNPQNNPFIQQIANLNAQRDQLLTDTRDAVKDIKDDLKEALTLH